MKRRGAGVDLLPLLDVMMTVTFTFATIREVELGGAVTVAATARTERLRAEERAVSAEDQRRDAVTRAAAAEALADRATAQRAASETVRAAAVAAQKHLERKLADANHEAKLLRERAHAAPDGERIDSVLAHLLKRSSVVEVELVGVVEGAGGVPENRCCFRADPRGAQWASCGVLPAQAADLDEWARDAGELFRALEETKGGNAIAVVRQASSATYRSGEKLERFIRERVPDRTVYREERGLDLPARSCGATAP